MRTSFRVRIVTDESIRAGAPTVVRRATPLVRVFEASLGRLPSRCWVRSIDAAVADTSTMASAAASATASASSAASSGAGAGGVISDGVGLASTGVPVAITATSAAGVGGGADGLGLGRAGAAASVALPASAPLTKFKICFLGDQGVGKTSIIRNFQKGQFDGSYKVRLTLPIMG